MGCVFGSQLTQLNKLNNKEKSTIENIQSLKSQEKNSTSTGRKAEKLQWYSTTGYDQSVCLHRPHVAWMTGEQIWESAINKLEFSV